jgi:hypothetical protein
VQLTVGLAPASGVLNSTTVVTALQITGLRVVAKVKKSVRLEPGTTEISVYNLNADHRAQVRERGLPIILAAGYTNTIGQIFQGVVKYADSVRNGPDWVTKIQCGDGEVSYRFARLTQAWGAGTSIQAVATALVNTLGPQAAITAQSLATLSGTFPRGYSVSGPAAQELDRLLALRGLEWHFDGGKVVVLQQGQTTGETAVLLSQSTGLVGSPEHGTPSPDKPAKSTHTLKVKALLQSAIRPACLVQVQSDGIGATTPAFFRAEAVTHDLDTHSGPWYTEVECNPVKGGG